MIRSLIALIISVGMATLSSGQNQDSQNRGAPNSRSPGSSSTVYGSQRTSKKVSAHKYLKGSSEELIREYNQRVRKSVKQYKREQKMMTKPRYSNPLYYGHKRPPKIRKVGKRKFCKTCEIVH